MKIAIVSDTHDNIPNIDEGLRLIKEKGVGTIIHCGDVSAPSVIKYLSENFTGKTHLVNGNVDGDHQTIINEFNLKNVSLYGEVGEIVLDKKKLAWTHHPDTAKALAASGKYGIVFYGHTHKPWEETINQTKMVNPGTLAGLFSKPTFAFYD